MSSRLYTWLYWLSQFETPWQCSTHHNNIYSGTERDFETSPRQASGRDDVFTKENDGDAILFGICYLVTLALRILLGRICDSFYLARFKCAWGDMRFIQYESWAIAHKTVTTLGIICGFGHFRHHLTKKEHKICTKSWNISEIDEETDIVLVSGVGVNLTQGVPLWSGTRLKSFLVVTDK